MIDVKRDEDGRFCCIEDNAQQSKIRLYDFRARQVTVKKRCAICSYAEIVESGDSDFIVCSGFRMKIPDDVADTKHCLFFDISNQTLNDIYEGLLK